MIIQIKKSKAITMEKNVEGVYVEKEKKRNLFYEMNQEYTIGLENYKNNSRKNKQYHFNKL